MARILPAAYAELKRRGSEVEDDEECAGWQGISAADGSSVHGIVLDGIPHIVMEDRTNATVAALRLSPKDLRHLAAVCDALADEGDDDAVSGGWTHEGST